MEGMAVASPMRFVTYIPTIINGSLLLALIGGLIQVNVKAESLLAQQRYAIPEIRQLRETVTRLEVTIAGMQPLLEAVAKKKIPPADVVRRLNNLERRLDRMEYGSVKN